VTTDKVTNVFKLSKIQDLFQFFRIFLRTT
jgi:hypothetical protein